MVKVNDKNLLTSIDYLGYQDKVSKINEMIASKSGPGNDFLGWLNYPETFDKVEFEKIIECAEYIRKNFEVLVVCGRGGPGHGGRPAEGGKAGRRGRRSGY